MPKYKTNKEFRKEVYDLVGNEYTFLEYYQGAITKIKVRHERCGNTYEVKPSNFLSGKRCPYCRSYKDKKTDDMFRKEVYDLVGNEYTFLEHYQGSDTKIRVKHSTCGNTYEVKPSKFLSGNRCPYCIGYKDKKTDEEFKQEVYTMVGDEYRFLDKYVNTRTKIRVKHNKCGNIYEVAPHDFLRGNRCPYCSIKDKSKTDEDFKQEVYSLVGDEYSFLEHYQGALNKTKVKHNKCGNIYEVSPNNFLNGSRCPHCYGTPKKADIQFHQEVHTLVGDEYTFLDKYVNAMTKIRIKHNQCGNIYEVSPNNFIHGSRCPYCSTKDKSKTDNQFQQEINFLVGNEYTFLGKYINNHTKLRVKHNKCGNTYEVTPSNFIQGNRCPYCFGNAKKTDDEFKQEVYNLVGNDYLFLDSYVNANNKIRVKHNKCKNIYEVSPSNFLRGSRCPYCNSPKGEIIILKILDNLNINYDYQKTFDDLKDKDYLSYDFYIPDQNTLIEYQGIQHYQLVDYFGGETKFKSQQKHDQMKLDYAKEHGYNLITVPYTEDSLPKVKKYLTKHGLNK